VQIRSLLGASKAVVDRADAVADGLAGIIVTAAARRLQRRGAVRRRGLHRLEPVLGVDVDDLRDLLDRRLAAQLADDAIDT
jgi:hypothetical protein